MSTPKSSTSRKKARAPAPASEESTQAKPKPVPDGLTGQGSDSVIPHLREYEQKRKDRSRGKE